MDSALSPFVTNFLHPIALRGGEGRGTEWGGRMLFVTFFTRQELEFDKGY